MSLLLGSRREDRGWTLRGQKPSTSWDCPGRRGESLAYCRAQLGKKRQNAPQLPIQFTSVLANYKDYTFNHIVIILQVNPPTL